MEEIIFKQLSNERLSGAEKEILERWLDDPKNIKVYNQMKINMNGPSQVELEAMMGDVWEELSPHIIKDAKTKKIRRLPDWLKVAASFLLISFLGAFIYFETKSTDREEITERLMIEKESLLGQKLTFSLPDGSSVKLNAGSKLIFPEKFDEQSREVKLEGEAFFDISRDINRPFRINTKDFKVEVLGTSFNVKAYANDESSVAVKSGKVSVELFDDDTRFLLDPNEIVSYFPTTDKLEKYKLEDTQWVFGWTEKQLIYKNSNIDHILKDLSKWYGVEFEIQRRLNTSKTISGKYDNPPLFEVMESLSFAYDFKFEIEKSKVIIR